MAKQVHHSPARNGQPETAGAAQLPKRQCQEVSIVHLKSVFVLLACGSLNKAHKLTDVLKMPRMHVYKLLLKTRSLDNAIQEFSLA